MTRPTEEAQQAAIARLIKAMQATDSLPARLRVARESVSGRMVFSTSLGAEDQVVLHAICASDAGSDIEIVTLDTGRHFSETIELVDTSQRHFARKISVLVPDREAVEELTTRDGVLGFRHSIEARKACCHVRKVEPLRRALAGAAVWITGLRRDQSPGRAAVPFAAWDAEHALIKLNPLADWSLDRLETYIAENHVPISPLHAQGYPSIGCQPCTRPIGPGEDLRAGRWWWEGQEGKECGLHRSPAQRAARDARRKEEAI